MRTHPLYAGVAKFFRIDGKNPVDNWSKDTKNALKYTTKLIVFQREP
jgi:hypothetical protein